MPATGLWLFGVTGPEDNEVDSLAFETLMPKPILQRYVSLLSEHRRVILCGSSGTGKTFLAHKLAEYLIRRLVCSLYTLSLSNNCVNQRRHSPNDAWARWCSGWGVGLVIERSRVRLPAGALPGSLGQLSLPSSGVGKSSTSLLAEVKAGRVHLCRVAGVIPCGR